MYVLRKFVTQFLRKKYDNKNTELQCKFQKRKATNRMVKSKAETHKCKDKMLCPIALQENISIAFYETKNNRNARVLHHVIYLNSVWGTKDKYICCK